MSIQAGQYGEILLGEALKAFTGVVAPINAMSRATSYDALNIGDQVKVPFSYPNSASATFNYSSPYGNDTTTLGVYPVTLNSLQYQKFSIFDADASKLNESAILTFAQQSGERLALDVISASFASVINDTNYPTSASCTNGQLTSSVAIANLVTQCDNALWGKDNRNIVLSPAAWNNLTTNPNLNQAFSYGGSQVVQNGLPTSVYGFNVYKTVVAMPNNCKALVLNPNAVLFGTGLHKPASTSAGLVTFLSNTVNGVTISLKSFYDAYNAKTVYIFECLSGVATGNTTGLFQMK